MNIIDTLITDRTQADVYKLNAMLAKGFPYWTNEELYFWLYGEPEPLSATDGDLYDADDELIIVGEGVIRGAYNSTDLNRVGSAVYYLQERLHDIAGESPVVVAKRDWTEADIPTEGQMTTYLSDVSAIRAEVEDAMPENTPDIPADMDGLTYSEANDIEQNLWLVNEVIMKIMQSWRYAGEIYSGEV